MAWSRPLLAVPVIEGLRLIGAVSARTQAIVEGALAVIGARPVPEARTEAETPPGPETPPEPAVVVPDPVSEAEVAEAEEAEVVVEIEEVPEPAVPEPEIELAQVVTEDAARGPAVSSAPPASVTPFPSGPRRRYRAGWPPPPVRAGGPGAGPGGRRPVPVRPVPSRVLAEASPAGSPAPETDGATGPPESPPSPTLLRPPLRGAEPVSSPKPRADVVELTGQVERVVVGAERFRAEIEREARQIAAAILDDAAAEARRILELAVAEGEEEVELARLQASRLVAEGEAQRESLIARGRREVAALIAEGEEELRRRGERIAELTAQITEMLERTTRRRARD